MRTIVYLDVDGVINAVSKGAPKANTQWNGEWSREEVMKFYILWSHELVENINELAARDDVTVKWLTTWQELAPKELCPVTGIEGQLWEVLYGDLETHGYTGNRWWKLDSLMEDLDKEQPDKVVWIDDDINYHRWTGEWLKGHPEILPVCPNTMHGVTKKQFDGIIEFINAK
jgi:hypothetical protein